MDFRGIKLSIKTYRSSADPDALLFRKSEAHPALPSYRAHVPMDNRHALIVDWMVTQATGTGERDAAQVMAEDRPGANQQTIGADKNYDTRGFVAEMRRIAVTPHVAHLRLLLSDIRFCPANFIVAGQQELHCTPLPGLVAGQATNRTPW